MPFTPHDSGAARLVDCDHLRIGPLEVAIATPGGNFPLLANVQHFNRYQRWSRNDLPDAHLSPGAHFRCKACTPNYNPT